MKQQTELVTLLVTIHQQRAPKVDILAKALILADVQPDPRVKGISYWLNCQLCRMKFKSRADISAHMETHPVSGMITRTSFCCKETFRYKSLRVETGLATSSIFQFSFLQKIIDLLGGQINDPLSGKHFYLLFIPEATPESQSRTRRGLIELT